MLTLLERKLIGRFQHRYGPNRVGPFGILQPLADVGKLLSKQAFQPAGAIPTPVRHRPVAVGLLRRAGAGDHPLGRRPARRRPLRDRRPDRHPLLLRGRLDRLLRGAARRLVLGLEIQPARRDARRRAADLLRGLDGAGAARSDHDVRLPLAGRHRPRPGAHLVRRAADRRLPDLHGRRLRRDQPRPLRPARGRRRAGPGLHHRIQRDALRQLRCSSSTWRSSSSPG